MPLRDGWTTMSRDQIDSPTTKGQQNTSKGVPNSADIEIHHWNGPDDPENPYDYENP